MEVQKTEEYEGSVSAVRSHTSPHVVDIAVELRDEDVHVSAAIEFCERKFQL